MSVVRVANSTPPGDMSASHPPVALQFARVTVHQPLLATAVDVICAPLSPPLWWQFLCRSLRDWVCCQDWHRYGCILIVPLAQSVVQWVAYLIAQNSVFSWIMFCCWSSCRSASHHNVSHQLLCVNVCDDTVMSFWELESVGIISEDLESAIDPVLQEFENSFDFVDGRYEGKLPWCHGASSHLQNNEKLAAIRLRKLNHHITHGPE